MCCTLYICWYSEVGLSFCLTMQNLKFQLVMLYFFTESMVLFWFISYQTTNKYQAKQLIVCCYYTCKYYKLHESSFLYVKEEPDTFRLSPLGKIDLFTLFIL